MSRFIDARTPNINVDSVKAFWRTPDRRLCIELVDGETISVVPEHADCVARELRGEYHIVQVIPAVEPVYAVYEDDDEHFARQIHYLGLCADGEIRAVELCCDGYFEIADASNYIGCYSKEDLTQWPNIEVFDSVDKE